MARLRRPRRSAGAGTVAIGIGSAAGLAALALPARAGAAPLDYFLHAQGPAARPTMYLDWAMTGLSVVVCLIIAGLLLGAILRRRPPAEPGAVGAERGGMAWIYIGVGVSAAVLLAFMIYMLVVLAAVAKPPSAPALSVTVTAYDWWWRIDYGGADPARGSTMVTTANEMHIPVGRPVHVLLKSADVIHAFWVPQLAGKTQTIPGQTNEQWLQADAPGVYRGQCTQYCGAQHAHMAFQVIAQPPAAFAQWLAAQARGAAPVAAGLPAAGQKVFLQRCAGCHAVRGTAARGAQAPDLTHVVSRRLLAAGTLPDTPANLAYWSSMRKPSSPVP